MHILELIVLYTVLVARLFDPRSDRFLPGVDGADGHFPGIDVDLFVTDILELALQLGLEIIRHPVLVVIGLLRPLVEILFLLIQAHQLPLRIRI